VMDFRMTCKLQTTVEKLCDKTALNYQLTRNLKFLYLRCITDRETNRKQLKVVIGLLVQCNRARESEADDILRQYGEYIEAMLKDHSAQFLNFKPQSDRLDTLFFQTMAEKEQYNKLWEVARMLLILSHGQAQVERGFSINRQMEQDNMDEETCTARRTVCDYVAHLGGADKVDVTNKHLLLHVTSARQKYCAYLDEQKAKKAAEQHSKKRKSILDEIDELKKKKQRLQKDVDVLSASADELAEKGEKSHCVSSFIKSNSLRRSVKDTMEDLRALEVQLDNKLQELKEKM